MQPLAVCIKFYVKNESDMGQILDKASHKLLLRENSFELSSMSKKLPLSWETKKFQTL